jgi:hypothetical protein
VVIALGHILRSLPRFVLLKGRPHTPRRARASTHIHAGRFLSADGGGLKKSLASPSIC